jgi:prevent-host-death family protein
METLTASDAKREFGDLLLKVQSAPVGINKNGKPVAVMLSYAEYELLAAHKTAQLKAQIQQGIADLDAGRIASGNVVLERLRQRVK